MKTIKVAGIFYNIIEKGNDEMQGRIGLANFNTQEIWIGKEHTEQTKKIAIIHEIVHILSSAYGLELTENQVKIGTHALIGFMSENPGFML
jgi:hypothetical protein